MGEFLFLFSVSRCNLASPVVGNHIETLLVRDLQFPADFRVIQAGGLVGKGGQFLPLFRSQRGRIAALNQADVIDIVQKPEIFKGVSRLCGARLSVLKCTRPPRLLDLVPAIRTPAGACVKGTLSEKNIKIYVFNIRAGESAAKPPLCRENLPRLRFYHVPADGSQIVAAFVPLMVPVPRIAEEHLRRCAVAVFLHAGFVSGNGAQKFPIFFRCLSFPVGLETAPLGEVEQNPGKLTGCHLLVQGSDTQGVDIFQVSLIQAVQLLLRYNVSGDKQSANTFLAVAAAAKSSAGASGLPSGRRKGCPGFGLFGDIKNPHAHIQNAVWRVILVKRHYSPSH